MTVRDELNDLKFRLRLKTDEELAVVLNTSKASIDRWISRKEIPQKWRRIIEMQFGDVNKSFSLRNAGKTGSMDIEILRSAKMKEEAGEAIKYANGENGRLARYVIESDPSNEYEDIDDIKNRLDIKSDKELAKLLQTDEDMIKELRDEGEKPNAQIQEAARVVERKMKKLINSYGGMDDKADEWGVIKTNEALWEIYDKARLRVAMKELVGGNAEKASE